MLVATHPDQGPQRNFLGGRHFMSCGMGCGMMSLPGFASPTNVKSVRFNATTTLLTNTFQGPMNPSLMCMWILSAPCQPPTVTPTSQHASTPAGQRPFPSLPPPLIHAPGRFLQDWVAHSDVSNEIASECGSQFMSTLEAVTGVFWVQTFTIHQLTTHRTTAWWNISTTC